MRSQVENRKDLIRDETTGAILYVETPEIKARRKIERVENELNSVKEELSNIKQLLERLIDGR